jgi:hypothetical protein
MRSKQGFLFGHLVAALMFLVSAMIGLGIYIAVQSTRPEPLPTLVWSPDLSDAQVLQHSPMILDRLGKGWWWVYADRAERAQLKAAGATVAIAFPTPLAQMAGCSI